MTAESTLDPILKTRLDLLEQAVDEVNGVISAGSTVLQFSS